MSRFFRSGAVSDSSESESSESDVEEVVKKPAFTRDFGLPSDSEEDEKRVVRAHKDRKFEDLKSLIKQVNISKNNKDINKVLQGFDDLAKQYEKSKTIFARQNIVTPRFYLRYLVDLEDFLNNLWEDKEAVAKLSKINSKALGSLRQKVRKYVKGFEEKIGEYRANPDPPGFESADEADEIEEKAASDDDDDDEDVVVKQDRKVSAKKAVEDLASDSDDWASDSGSSSSDDDVDFGTKKMEDLRRYFLKKEFRGQADAKDKDEIAGKRARRVKDVVRTDLTVSGDEDGEEWTPVTKEKQVQLFEPKQEVTHEVMVKKLNEVMAARGRLGTDRKQHVRLLQELNRIADEKNLGVGITVKIMFNIISSLFDLNAKISDFMDFNNFNKTMLAVNELLDILIENPKVKLSVKYSEEDEILNVDAPEMRVQGSILMTVQRLDSELTKILQNADCHSNDYIEKLKGEKDMCVLIERTEKYVDERLSLNIFDVHEVCKVYMMRIEHLYYKYHEPRDGEINVGDVMERLCKKIYSLDDEKRLRQRAMLCHVYWLALHDLWSKAKDLMLMSHLQAIVDHSDTDTQILYNRTMCQLGLCAFRHGLIKEAHQALSEIQNTQRAKELLAQALTLRQQHERTAEQEKVERQRQVPYHMHINVELMECVYLICSMLLEIPHMASCEFEMRRRLLSRSFHYQLKQSEKSSLVGPPENTREHVVAASRAMLAGDWRKCRDYIVNDKMNHKVWNLFRNAEHVKAMVVGRIQEESLRTYLLMYSTVYTTVSLVKLATLFELDKKHVHSVMSKMIINEELSATLDEPSDCLMMHRVEPSRLQMLALNLTDKLQLLTENNEQIVEPRSGRSGYVGSGVWFAGRERDKQKTERSAYQGERRTQTDSRRPWGAQQQAQRRRAEPSKSRF